MIILYFYLLSLTDHIFYLQSHWYLQLPWLLLLYMAHLIYLTLSSYGLSNTVCLWRSVTPPSRNKPTTWAVSAFTTFTAQLLHY